MLKAGIMEDGLVRASEEGTSQGSILSPLLSNIYLHYTLDLWFSGRFKKCCKGEVYYFRFADDFLACFQYESDAVTFREQLEDRLQRFNLELALEKTHAVLNLAGMHGRMRGRRVKSPRSLTFWVSRTIAARLERDISNLKGAPVVRSSD